MKILVVSGNAVESAQLAAILGGSGDEARLASTDRSALSILGSEEIGIVLVCLAGPAPALVDLVRQIRSMPSASSLHILLIVRDVPEAVLISALDAGADGDIRYPFSRDFLLARLRTAQRAIRLRAGASDTRQLITPGPSVLSSPPQSSPGTASQTREQLAPIDQVVRANAWRNAPATLTDAGSKFLTLSVSNSMTIAAGPPPEAACGILLSSTQHSLELRLAIGVDRRTASALATHLFGADEPGMSADMLGELANIFMGAMKTSFSTDSFAFTGGLPETLLADQVLRPITTFKHQVAFQLLMADARLVVHLGLRSKANVFLTPSELREGMIVASDLFNARGILLLHRGTRLTQNMIDRLKTALVLDRQIEVMAP